MQAIIFSDLHFEFHPDHGRELIETLADAEVAICAGDLSNAQGLANALRLLCARYPSVIFVAGNHEFYGGRVDEVRQLLQELTVELPNLHYLENSMCEIEGRKFIGSTLWFRPTTETDRLANYINDFQLIENAQSAIYAENAKAIQFLEENVTSDTIVVTHHLPTLQCVHPKYAGSPINCFFVCDVEELIQRAQPPVWVHGHTHSSNYFQLGKTTIICNPFGYANHEENPGFRPDLLVEI
jgi:Icc-related predicted phosphoesterase